MSIDTLNKNVLKMLSHLNKYPIPDPQMTKDFKWFINAYNLSVKSGEVTAPGSGACDSCCPAPNAIGSTVTETKFNVNGPGLAFDITNNIIGIKLDLLSVVEKRVYAIKISFSGNFTGIDLALSYTGTTIPLDPNGINWYGVQNLQDGDPTPEFPITDSVIYIYCNNPSITPSMLIGKEVTISLFTA